MYHYSHYVEDERHQHVLGNEGDAVRRWRENLRNQE